MDYGMLCPSCKRSIYSTKKVIKCFQCKEKISENGFCSNCQKWNCQRCRKQYILSRLIRVIPKDVFCHNCKIVRWECQDCKIRKQKQSWVKVKKEFCRGCGEDYLKCSCNFCIKCHDQPAWCACQWCDDCEWFKDECECQEHGHEDHFNEELDDYEDYLEDRGELGDDYFEDEEDNYFFEDDEEEDENELGEEYCHSPQNSRRYQYDDDQIGWIDLEEGGFIDDEEAQGWADLADWYEKHADDD